jgi:ABC-type multidrug transport system permease subunit
MSLGFAISAISPSGVLANALGPPIAIVFIIFGGFYINSASLPMGSQWVQYISYIKWAFEGLAINEFSGEKFECDLLLNTSTNTLLCESTGEIVLLRLSFADTSVIICILGLLVFLLVALLLTYILLLLTGDKFLFLKEPIIINIKDDINQNSQSFDQLSI